MSEAAKFDELCLDISSSLYRCDVSILQEVARILKVDADTITTIGDSRRKIITELRKSLDDLVEKGDSDIEEQLNTVSVYLEQTLKTEEDTKHFSELTKLNEKLIAQTQMLAENDTKTMEIDTLTKRLHELTGGSDRKTILYKELKIHGKVGDPGDKNNIPYISLLSQITDAVAQSYSEKEIIRAVSLKTEARSLRAIIDGYPNLTVARLKTLLCTHYKEKSATDLCTRN